MSPAQNIIDLPIAYMRDYVIEIINCVEDRWQERSLIYRNGYAVFYGRVIQNPHLMLIGLNPGGDQEGINWYEEAVSKLDQDLEYIKYRNSTKYPLARETYQIFDDLGQTELLANAVKLNTFFFRSKNWDGLPKQKDDPEIKCDISFCKDIVFEVISEIKPRVILCEGIGVLDIVKGLVYKNKLLTPLRKPYKRGNRRKYASYKYIDSDLPQKLLGITHLSGSWPSNEDKARITEYLSLDLTT